MSFERFQFSCDQEKLPTKKILLLAGGIPFAYGWISSGLGAGITAGVFCSLIALTAAYFFGLRRNANLIRDAAQADLVKRGYNVDFQLGTALIDSKSKMLAFVDLENKAYDLFSAGHILGWEHQWVDKTTAETNAWGDRAVASTRQTSNVFVFKTDNPARPLYKIPIANHRVGEVWMARISAIVNG